MIAILFWDNQATLPGSLILPISKSMDSGTGRLLIQTVPDGWNGRPIPGARGGRTGQTGCHSMRAESDEYSLWEPPTRNTLLFWQPRDRMSLNHVPVTPLPRAGNEYCTELTLCLSLPVQQSTSGTGSEGATLSCYNTEVL